MVSQHHHPSWPTLLLVEDSALDAVMFDRARADVGLKANVVHVASCEDALVAIDMASMTVDLAVIDLSLGDGSGTDVSHAMRGSATYHRVPVIIFSSSPRVQDVNAAYERGASAYIVKPYDYEDLKRVLAAIKTFWFEVARLPV